MLLAADTERLSFPLYVIGSDGGPEDHFDNSAGIEEGEANKDREGKGNSGE